jgi:hypothetical protein
MAILTKILSRRVRFSNLFYFGLLVMYIGFSLYLFFRWVDPSLDGRTDQHIAADSGTYISYSESLREGRNDPVVIAALFSFPNNLWCPVLIALALKTTFATVLANYLIFFLSLALLKKTFSFSGWGFIWLMLLNATTTISLLSVNKEIVDLLMVSVFLFALRRQLYVLLILSLLLATFNRFEVGIVMLLFLFAKGKLNPLRRRRAVTLVVVILMLSVMLPLFASNLLNAGFEEAKEGHTVAFLDYLEIHYMYFLAVIPKIAENLFAEIINFGKLGAYLEFFDIANTYIVFFNNLATAVVVLILAWKRSFTVKDDLIYFAVLGWIMMAIALVIQPRYFYFAFVLLCIKAAQAKTPDPDAALRETRNRDASLLDRKEAVFG